MKLKFLLLLFVIFSYCSINAQNKERIYEDIFSPNSNNQYAVPGSSLSAAGTWTHNRISL